MQPRSETETPPDSSLAEGFWSACLSNFHQELPAQQFNTWIKPLRFSSNLINGNVCVLAPNPFVLRRVREHYLAKIEVLYRQFFSDSSIITLLLDPLTSSNAARSLPEEPLPKEKNLSKPVLQTHSAVESSKLNQELTFETLVSGRSNDLARAAAQQVALNPGCSYNPLFVYGGVGLGKTHLVHALGNEVVRSNPKKVIRYIHAHDYIADVIRAYQQKAFDAFKRYYCSLDLLIIDDIQFLNGKDRTQEEFFFAFNALIEAKKQIVITCDTYPKDIQGLENRLISRFDWGLTVQVEPPELEMRVAILKKKAEKTGIILNDDVAFLIAKNLRSNVRELEGALNRVIAYAGFHACHIHVEVAKEALKDVIGAYNRQVSMESIQKTVADYFRIKVSEMHAKGRTRTIVRPRQIAMWLSRELTSNSLPEIGEAFGGRDHTTVIHACKTVTELRIKDIQLKNDVHVLLQTIKG